LGIKKAFPKVLRPNSGVWETKVFPSKGKVNFFNLTYNLGNLGNLLLHRFGHQEFHCVLKHWGGRKEGIVLNPFNNRGYFYLGSPIGGNQGNYPGGINLASKWVFKNF